MFEVVGQDIISGNMGFIGTDPDRLYRMGAAEKTEDVTVTGNPAVLDNATGKPFRDLHIYGRSEQVTTTGAQLFDAASIKKNDKIQVEISDNSYTIQMTTTINESGSPSNRVYIAINHVIKGDFSGKTVTLSYDGVNSDVPNERYVIGLMYNTDDGRTHYLSLQKDMPKSISVTLPENTTNLTLRLFITEFTSPTVPAGTYTVTIQGAMLTEGSEKKDWEPYTGGKPSPSPDYTQEIKNAKGEVVVKGKNLIPVGYNESEIRYDKKTEQWKFDAMPTKANVRIVDPEKITWILPMGSYTVTMRDEENVKMIGVSDATEKEWVTLASAEYSKKQSTFSINKENVKLGMFLIPIDTAKPGRVRLQLENSSESTDYEPYRTPQTLTLSTPNGLPGIPVTSGGNYTDENGQQWICDEVDFGREMYVQRIASFMINDKNANDIRVTNSYTNVTVAVNARINTPEKTIASSITARRTRSLFCEALPWMEDEWARTVNSAGFVENDYIDFTIENSYLGLSEASTNDERKAALVKYFTDKPCQIVYRIATPIETPLTASEISAYKSLRTYKGTTIVEAEDKAGISVTYRRSAKTDNTSAERKIEESEKKEYDES